MLQPVAVIEQILWPKLPDWQVAKLDKLTYAVKIGRAVQQPTIYSVYSDVNVQLNKYVTDANLVLGYTFILKRDHFKRVERSWWVSLLSDVPQHHTPSVVYSDQQVFLYRFNNRITPSYWFLSRWRTT